MTLHAFINEFLAAVEPVVVAFAVALFTVGTLAVYNWGRLRGLQGQVKQLGAGGATTFVAVPPTPVAGSGRPALAARADDQNNDVLPDGQLDPWHATSCGEECSSMAIEAMGGPSIPAGVLRVLLGGLNRPGMSTGADIVYLLLLFKIASHTRSADADSAWVEWEHSFNAKYLVIARGYWVTVGYPHWVLIRETTEQGIMFNDPWGGLVRTMDKATAQKLYLGDYVHIDQPVTAPAAGPPAA